MIKNIVIVAIGGGIGSVVRYLLTLLVIRNTFGAFPWATFIVNITGCLVIGLLFGLAERSNVFSSELRLFLAVGICGGFTTFSTFANEAFVLIRNGQFFYTALYLGLSVFLGVIFVYLGYVFVNLIR